MASLIEGYENDIFISYRQKDNKHDGWVTKFVENLKGELEATFKEDISVYFDENPHNRLQETHNVDKSLEGKLKCLIFIPILSQTYCDPNCYAWQYEFLPFIQMAEADQFGRDVKLRSGNFASRILPIRIHDLDDEDVKLFEKENGSVLRAMDFIFKTSSGVSRPLLSNEDHPNENLNKTFYRDQINKVARSIKEIVQELRTESVVPVKEKTLQLGPLEQVSSEEKRVGQASPIKLPKRKLLSGIIIIGILIIAAIFAYPKIFKRDSVEKLRSSGERISVAVMPFQNMTNDTIWNIWQVGIQFNITTSLSNYSNELKVSQTESINGLLQSNGITNYTSLTPSVASTISQKLDANVFISGNINKVGNLLRVNAQQIDSKTKEIFKSFQIEGNSEKILSVIDSISTKIADFLLITILRKENIEFQKVTMTDSPLAYKYFILGKNARYKGDYATGIKWFKQALDIDSNFTIAIRFISTGYRSLNNFEEAKKWCLRLYSKKDIMSLEEKLWTEYVYAQIFETNYEAIKCLRQIQEIDNQSPPIYYNLGNNYRDLLQYDKAILELEKALDIYNKWGSKPLTSFYYGALGDAYHKAGEFKKEKRLYMKAMQDFPEENYNSQKASLSLIEGDTSSAYEYIRKVVPGWKDNSEYKGPVSILLANIYFNAGLLNKAEEYYQNAVLLQPDNPYNKYVLARFLIENDRNINQGTELIYPLVKLYPDSYDGLDCYGWGLYKQGKYKEALDILRKSWDLRKLNAVYNHVAFLHLEAAKKAVDQNK